MESSSETSCGLYLVHDRACTILAVVSADSVDNALTEACVGLLRDKKLEAPVVHCVQNGLGVIRDFGMLGTFKMNGKASHAMAPKKPVSVERSFGYEGDIKRLDIMLLTTPDHCVEALVELDAVITKIELQLDAKHEGLERNARSGDPKWEVNARHALRKAKAKRFEVQNWHVHLVRAGNAREISPKSKCFYDAAKELLPPETFDKVLALSKAKREQEKVLQA